MKCCSSRNYSKYEIYYNTALIIKAFTRVLASSAHGKKNKDNEIAEPNHFIAGELARGRLCQERKALAVGIVSQLPAKGLWPIRNPHVHQRRPILALTDR